MKKTFKIFRIATMHINVTCIETLIEYSDSFDTLEEAEEKLFDIMSEDKNRTCTFTILPEYKLLD